MAAMPPVPSPSVQTSRRSKEGRSRPNLTKICQKTKMCSFHLRGMCKRAESCSFAHDPNEIQAKPDLACTKLCPVFLSEGHCPRMSSCKFAHNEAELRVIAIEDADICSDDAVIDACAPSGTSERNLSHADNDAAATLVTTQMSRTSPQVVCRLNDAIASGALTMCGMIFHLTRIFLAVYEARPEVAKRVRVPADTLAAATAAETWADAGLDSGSLLSFNDFVRFCALPAELMPQHLAQNASREIPASLQQAGSNKGGAPSDASTDDSDAWSQCSTNDSFSEVSLNAPMEWHTPSLWDELEDVECEPEVRVVNTFIHVSAAPSPVTVKRRARSVPKHFGRQE